MTDTRGYHLTFSLKYEDFPALHHVTLHAYTDGKEDYALKYAYTSLKTYNQKHCKPDSTDKNDIPRNPVWPDSSTLQKYAPAPEKVVDSSSAGEPSKLMEAL